MIIVRLLLLYFVASGSASIFKDQRVEVGSGGSVDIVLARRDELTSRVPQALVDIGDASLDLYQLFCAVGPSRFRYVLSNEGVNLEATDVSLSTFALLRSLLSTYACSGQSNSVYNMPFRTHSGEWAQAVSFGPACVNNYNHLLSLFSTDWSVFHPALQHIIASLLVSPSASMTLSASLSKGHNSSHDVLELLSELRISVVVQGKLQTSHVALLEALEAATQTFPAIGAPNGSVRLVSMNKVLPFGDKGMADLWRQVALTGDDNLSGSGSGSELGVGSAPAGATAERRVLVAPGSGGQLEMHLWLHNPTNTTLTLQVTEPDHPSYLLLLHTYMLHPGGQLISELPSFRLLPARREISAVGNSLEQSLSSLSWEVQLAPKQRLRASYAAQPQRLHRLAQPPDASRGVEASPVWLRELGSGRVLKTRPSRLLLPTAIPDQTMPWNVFALYSALLAFSCGCIINTLQPKSRS